MQRTFWCLRSARSVRVAFVIGLVLVLQDGGGPAGLRSDRASLLPRVRRPAMHSQLLRALLKMHTGRPICITSVAARIQTACGRTENKRVSLGQADVRTLAWLIIRSCSLISNFRV